MGQGETRDTARSLRSCAVARTRGLLAVAALAGLTLAGCTGDSSSPASGSTGSSTATGAASATTTPPTTASASPTSADVPGPTSRTESTTPPSAGSPTYFTPTDPAGFSMTGRISVEQALQDPFSNLLQRGALHGHPVTLDVVGTPDYPVAAGSPTTILFRTCKCDQRGSGLRLTVEDAADVTDAGHGDVRIKGTFTSTVTASDAITLRAVP